jgi:cytochrome b subunit of formate dehydrogenase
MGPHLERNSRRTRWLHAAVYLTTFVLLGTGWWLLLGREGDPSPLSDAIGTSDIDIHKAIGWGLAGIAVLALVLGLRGVFTFVVESVRFHGSDLRWFARWPRAIFTSEFPHHRGHFDPGQRIANIVMVGGLLALVVSGIGLVLVHGGPAFVWLSRIHRWSTYAVTPVIVGHVVVASGILPGYRGVWRSMHGRGAVDEKTARRLWPAWTDRRLDRGAE